MTDSEEKRAIIRKSLSGANAYAMAGVMFVPVPVFSIEQASKVADQAVANLENHFDSRATRH